MDLATVSESSEADFRRYVLREQRLANCGLLGRSPTVPENSSESSGELSRRPNLAWLLERSRLDEEPDPALLRFDRDDHWKLPASKLPERLDLFVGRPSVSASFAPS
jgi:hypothetical protein